MPKILSDATYARMMRVIERVEAMPIQGGLDPNQQGSVSPLRYAPFCGYIGKLTAACTKGSTGTLRVYEGEWGAETVTPSSFTVPFMNVFGNVSSGLWGAVVGMTVTGLYLISAESTC